MKTKSFISLLCLTLGVFLFQACNDVPAPYDIPGKGDANSIYGTGSKESPYTIKGAALNQNGGYAWVKAYIVGYIPTGDNTSSTISDIVFGTEGAGTTNIVIATSGDSKDINNCMAVQLPSGDVRNALNLQAHPENLGKEVMLYGTMEKYFGSAGVKTVTAAILDGQEIGDMPEESGEAIFSADFSQSLGDFTSISTSGTLEWYNDYSSAMITGYKDFNGDGEKENQAGVTFLVGPEIDLSHIEEAYVATNMAINYERGDLNANNSILISKNYTGDANNATWTQLTYDTEGLNSDFTFKNKKTAIPAELMGGKVRIALRHTCSDTQSSTWEVKKIEVIKGKIEDTAPEPPIEGENLLKNGGFETWENGVATGWKSSNSAGNATVTQSTDAHAGSYSAMIEGSTDANKRLGSTEITLKAGTYAIKAYFKAVDANASIRLGYAVNEADGSIAGGDSYKYGAYVNDITKDTWVEATHEFTLEANTTVNLVVMVGKNPGQSVLIDDFSLQTNDGGIIEGGNPEQPEEPGDAIFSESFANGIGSFTTADITGEQAWNADTQYKCMKMSAYANGTSVKNEDWLISPAIDLSKARTLTFEQAFGPYNKSMDNANLLYTVWVSNNYSGDVTTATWTQVTINYPAESGWAFSDAQATLPAIGAQAHLAFKYKNADGDETLTWEIKNVTVK